MWLTEYSEEICRVVIDESFRYVQLEPYLRSTLIGVADMKTYIDVLMRLREPMEELIRAHESTRDIIPKKFNTQDPKQQDAKKQALLAKERATENFLALVKEGKYFEPH